ncbi:MAG: TolC family outer membrane protein [Burkholderiales bacterium]|nr:TolC family outer membrane protein [Burkholderiales bacterium]
MPATMRAAALAVLCAAPVVASAVSLPEAFSLALQNDPRFRSARAESRASGMALDQARAGFRPTIRYDIDRTETRSNVLRNENAFVGVGARTFPTDSRTLSITQPIFRKEVIVRFDQAKSVVRQAEFTLLAAEQDLILRTTAAYLSVLAATDSLALASTEREAIGKVLDLARERLKLGLGTSTNLYDAQARFAITQARELEAQNKLRDTRQALREITGQVIPRTQTLRPEFALETPDPADADRWVETALEQNLLLRARREAVEVARQEVERQRSGHYPSINLLVNHNRRDAASSLVNGSFGPGTLVESTDVTVRLSVPIFEGGLTSAVTAEAAHRYQKSQEDLELERRAIERATRASYDGTLSAVNLVQALRQSVLAQENALAAKEQGFKAGLFPLLQVLDAQRDLYLARRDYAQARYDYLLYRLRLKLAAGTLAETDLVEVGKALQ